MFRRSFTQPLRRPLPNTLFTSPSISRPSPRWSPSSRAGYRYQVYYRDNPNYHRFHSKENIFIRWARRPTFYYEIGLIGGAGGVYYVYHLEKVPETGRRRFNVMNAKQEKSMSMEMYRSLLQEHRHQMLSSWDPRTQQVRRVLDRLIQGSGLVKEDWVVHVIKDPQANAFVIPGGKVFVFTGLLPIAQDDDGLATVLGHEIAHNVAHHAAERMSKSMILFGLASLLQMFSDPFTGWTARAFMDFMLLRPGSRAQESEADYIGLMIMAKSCFNPKAAIGLWERMEEAETTMPQFLSTHPSSHNRQKKIAQWLSEAEQHRMNSGCSSLVGNAEEFKKTYERMRW